MNVQRVGLDVLAPRLHGVTHKYSEQALGLHVVLDVDPQQRSFGRVEGRLLELLGIHFTEAFESLDVRRAIRGE